MRDFQSMSAKKKLEYVQQFAKTFDPNNNPPDVHGARPIATFEEFVKETKVSSPIFSSVLIDT